MNSRQKSFGWMFFLLLCFFPLESSSQERPVSSVHDTSNILPVKQQETLMNEFLIWRLDHILPDLMRREGIDMWLVLNRENNEDPVYMTLVPKPSMTARRRCLIFYDPGEGKEVERFDNSRNGTKPFYNGMPAEEGNLRQFSTPINIGPSSVPEPVYSPVTALSGSGGAHGD